MQDNQGNNTNNSTSQSTASSNNDRENIADVPLNNPVASWLTPTPTLTSEPTSTLAEQEDAAEDINSFIVPLSNDLQSENLENKTEKQDVYPNFAEVVETDNSLSGLDTNTQAINAEVQPNLEFTEAAPIIPNQADTTTQITPWGLETNTSNQTSPLLESFPSNTYGQAANLPQSPIDITAEMMATFLSQNQLDITNTNGYNNANAIVNTNTSVNTGAGANTDTIANTNANTGSNNGKSKKSSGGFLVIAALIVMIFLVVFIIYLLIANPDFIRTLTQNQTSSTAQNVGTTTSQDLSQQSTNSSSQISANSSSLTSTTSTTSTTQSQTSAENTKNTNTQTSAFSFKPLIPAGWVNFTDGFMGISFALPPQDGYVETQVNTTPQTVTSEIKAEWLAKPSAWFYAPSALTSFFGTDVNAKTLVLNRAPGRASGIGSICPTTESYCHIDISLKISVLNFTDSIAELVARIRATNPTLTITTSVSGQVWGVNSILMNIDYGANANPAKRNFSLIQVENNIYAIERYTKSENLLVEFSSVLNAIKIN